MESDLQRPSDHAGVNSGEHKSVLKKVKEKAKKIKETIKKHGHTHEGDDDHDDEEETVNVPPHVHGAPMHDSTLNKSPNLHRDTASGPITHEGLPKPVTPGMITHEGLPKPVTPGPIKHGGTPSPIKHGGTHSPVSPGPIMHGGTTSPVSPGPIKHGGTPSPVSPGPIKHGVTTSPVSSGPIKHGGTTSPVSSGPIKLGGTPSPVSGPIKHGGTPSPVSPGPIMHGGTPSPVSPGPIMHGGTARPVSPGPIMHEGMAKPVSPLPLAEAFGKRPAMAARETGDENSPKPKKKVGLEKDPHSPAVISKSNDQSKVVDPTGDGGEEANVAPLVGQFGNLNVLDKKPEPKQSSYHTGTHDDQFSSPQKTPTKNLSNPAYNPETENPDPTPMIQDSPTQSTITGKISAAATAATGTAISAKNLVAEKLGYGGGPQSDQGYSSSAGDTAAAGLRPGDENPDPSPKIQDSTNQNTITGKMSTAAISGKNAVASKLGYGGGPQDYASRTDGDTAAAGFRPGDEKNPNPSPKIQDSTNQNTITGKMSTAATAAADTAISTKNVVASKLGYGGGPQAGKGGETGTMKDNLAEKLRPGDGDKALSEVITGAFSKKEEAPVVEQPGSRVRVSAEVAARLGPATETKREGEDALAAGAESSGPGMVGRLKDAVGSWLGKSDGVQTAQDSIEGSYVSDATTGGGAKRES